MAVGIMLRVTLWVLAAIALFAVVPGSAAALPQVPPGNSEVDQYLPTVPGPGGDKPLGGGGGASRGSSLPPSTVAKLQAAGPDGAAAVAAAEQSDPSRGAAAAGGGGGSGASGSSGSAGSAHKSVGGAVVDALSDGNSGGMGIFLPFLLCAVAAAGGYAVARRRFRGGGSAGA